MSLSWKKRQALASDQKSWRALGLDSALWKGIEKNSGNVKTALGGLSTEGIVTNIKFIKTEGVNLTGLSGADQIWVSDPSNAAVASVAGINSFDSPHPTSTAGTGLGFSMKKYGGETFNTQAVPHDISGIKYRIHNGGKGYKVGDTFTVLQGTNQYGKEMTLTGSTTTVLAINAGDPIIQEAYKITNFDAQPAATASAGDVVNLLDGPGGSVMATGLLHTAIGGVPPLPLQTVKVISTLGEDFEQSGVGWVLNINAIDATTTIIPGLETTRKAAVNGFVTTFGSTGTVTNPTICQTLEQYQTNQFESTFAQYEDAVGGVFINRAQAEAATITDTDSELADLPNTGVTSTELEGRLSIRVTGITSTKIEPGRN